MLRYRVIAVMKQVAFKETCSYFIMHFIFIMRINAAPFSFSAIKKTQLSVGIPAAVPDPLTAIIGQTVHLISIQLPVVFYFQYALYKLRTQRFISIHGKKVMIGR